MSPELPAPLRRFAELVEREEYWESHEALEDAWRETGSDFYQGLILYASAFVHAQRGTRHGILAQLEKAERALGPYAPSHLGVDVATVLRHAERCRGIVEAREEPPTGEGWAEALPSPVLELDPSLVRGDEPELGTG